jgi:hypothetical protein
VFDISRGKEVKEREDAGILVPVTDEHGVVQKGANLTVVGSYSDTYKKNADAYRKYNLEQQREPSEDEIETVAYACGIKSWEGLTSNGEPFPHSIQNAISLLDACPWMFNKVRLRVFDHSSFFTQPSPA